MTSAQAVAKVKRLLKAEGIATKVGHFGTLDPDGEGVLPIALGYATRLFSYDLNKKKVYYALFTFGRETDTLDASGEVISEGGRIPNKAEIENTLPFFIGKIEQIPPKYSAKLIDGHRAYKLARKGEEITLIKSFIDIYDIQLLEKTAEDTFAFRIECGSGTYIRSLARDLAYRLNTYGYMKYIRRERNSIFSISDAVTLEQAAENICSCILPMNIFTDAFARYNVAAHLEGKLSNGVQIYAPDAPGGLFSVYCGGNLFGIGEKNSDDKLIVRTRLTK